MTEAENFRWFPHRPDEASIPVLFVFFWVLFCVFYQRSMHPTDCTFDGSHEQYFKFRNPSMPPSLHRL